MRRSRLITVLMAAHQQRENHIHSARRKTLASGPRQNFVILSEARLFCSGEVGAENLSRHSPTLSSGGYYKPQLEEAQPGPRSKPSMSVF